MKKSELIKAIARFKKIELKEVEKEKKQKKKLVCIDADSVIGKEIRYQTALLHEILDEIRGGLPPS